jgi:ribosomal protein S12 methylthiotransferase
MSPNERAPSSSPRVHLTTLGCAKNLVDSERLLGQLASAGALVGATVEDADILIVNTCGFIDQAKKESVDAILDLVAAKSSGRRARLFVMGCLAQRYAAELKTEIPEIDGVFGLGEQAALIESCGLSPQNGAGRLLLTPPHTAYLRISDGCDNRCSYCTIPLIRGPLRSRPAAEVLQEAQDLASCGVKELVVIGQDTTSYGADRPGEMQLHELLGELTHVDGPRWIRLLYAHPAHFTDALLEAYATLDKLCPYVDLPLQHASDPILQAMGRRTSAAACRRLIERLRQRVADIAIRTTFIVGFPGETNAQFGELVRFVREIRFDHVGVFAYSEEEGTPAVTLPNSVPERVKRRRLRRLMHAQQEIAFEAARRCIGQDVEVLIDRPTGADGCWIGRTAQQAPDVDPVTIVEGEGLRPGRFVHAVITGARGYDMEAKVKAS